MNGQITGTSIQDLHRNEKMEQYENIRNLNNMQTTQYGAMENLQYQQGHNVAHNTHQGQHQPYYNMEENYDYPQFLPRPAAELPATGVVSVMPPNQLSQVVLPTIVKEEPDIEDLAIDINNSLPMESIDRTLGETEDEYGNTSGGGYLGSIPSILREPLIILILFIILSEAAVKDSIGNYVPQLNPDMTGRVSRVGVVIYGVLLAILFIVVKKLIM